MDIHYTTQWGSGTALITNRKPEIKRAIDKQALNGTTTVSAHNSRRVYGARTRKGQLQVRFDDGRWYNAETVTIR